MKNLLLLLSCWLLTTTAYATRYFVKTNGNDTHDGQSWNTAFATLQKALESTSGNNDEIWVATGTYYPTVKNSTNNRSITFKMKNGVAIYGGFAGTENALADRASALIHSTNKTILSGDVDKDGILDDENAFQVIRNESVDNTAQIDGFTISDGYANGSNTYYYGGGMYNAAASPTVSNCRFINNRADNGGGMYNIASSPIITNCSFIENYAPEWGAGMYNRQSSSPIIIDCLFSKNESLYGGGMFILGSTPHLIRCVFSGNTATEGAGLVDDTSSSIFTNCSFLGNKATVKGGGASITYSTSLFTNCSMSGNQAPDGGGMYIYSSRPTTIKMRNCLIWGNSTDELSPAASESNVTYTFTNTIVKGMNNGTGVFDGTQDPLFVSQPDYSTAPTTIGDLQLKPCSPAINAGDNTVFNADQTPDLSTITTDLAGKSRIFNTTVDLGAYELQSAALVLYVKADGNDANDGLSWNTAFATLQKALETACSGKQIWIAAGTYYPSYTVATDRHKHFEMKNGVAIYGGFAGTETSLSERVATLIHTVNATILSGDIDKDGILDDDNAYQVIRNLDLNSTAQIEGVTISGGNANGRNTYHYGGGMFCSGATPTISNCRFMNNRADTGGAIYGSAVNVTNCSFIENHANEFGGAISTSNSSPTFTDCFFSNNTAGNGGGADLLGGAPNFLRCVFSGNSADNAGGVLNTGAGTVFTNCLFSGNKANNKGGAMYTAGSAPILTNCTFSGNKATEGGGLFIYETTGAIKLRNCLIWGNSTEVYPATALSNSNYTFSNTIIKGINNGTGVFDGTQDPLFVSQPDYNAAPTTLGNLQLQRCSSAINVGNNAVFEVGQTPDLSTVTTDLAGHSRIFNTTVDLGSYEYVSDNSLTVSSDFSNPTTCGGTDGRIKLSGLLFNTVYSVTYTKAPGSPHTLILTSDADGLITIENLTEGSYTNIIATYGSCVSNAVDVTLNDPDRPTIVLGVIPAICAGAAGTSLPFAELTASPDQYSIDYHSTAESAGFTDINQAALSASFLGLIIPVSAPPTTYTASLTVRNSTTGCISLSQDIVVSIHPQPVGPILNAKTPNTTSICFGTGVSAAFIAGSGGVGCSDDYVLIIDGGTPTTYTPGSIVGTTATASIVIQGRHANCEANSGCNGTGYVTLASWSVNPLPTATLTGTDTVCQNDPAPNITFIGNKGNAPYTYTYTINNGPHQTVTTTVGNTVTVSVPTNVAGLFVYTLVSVMESGPAQCSQNQSANATVTVKPTPSSALTASQTDVCPNTPVTLDAHCSIPTATVNWNPGAPTVTPNAPTTPYHYKASCSFDGCTGKESSVEVRTHRLQAHLKEVANGTLPQPILKAVKDNLAPTNTITAPASPRLWTIVVHGCAASESAVFKLSGPVNFIGIDNEVPYALFSKEGSNFYSINHPNYGNGSSFPNGTYTLTVELRSQDGAGGPFPKNRVATGALLATRTLQFTVGGSGATRQAAIGLDTGQRITENHFSAQIMPNPIAQSLHLKIYEAQGQAVKVNLMDALGRSILQRAFVPESNQHQEEFEIGHLANGMYFLKVNTTDNQQTFKVMKVQ